MVHPDGRFYYEINGEVFNFSEVVLKHAGKEIEPSEEPFATQWAEQTATQYQRDRAYPSIGDQLDMMMKDKRDGTTTHQTACEAVKAKYPKPS
jgi:hypothetical protein